jgi:hypothetical protein
VFSADEFTEPVETIGHPFRMPDEVGGVADDTRNQYLPGGEFHVRQTLNLCP